MSKKSGIRYTEKLILGNLELNARTPFSRFGKKIRKSQQQISYTVSSMINREIIQNFYTIIDYSKLDVLNFRVYFRINYIDEKKFQKLIDYLSSEPHISRLSTCGGRYDIICTFFTLNPSQFNKTLRNIMEKFSQQLKNYTVLTTIVSREFGRKYIFKNPIIPQLIVGGDRKPEKIDDIDMQILNELSEDARKKLISIGQKLDIGSKTIINRIKRLQKLKIIRGFRPLLNPEKIGMSSALLMIKYHNISAELEDKLINYLSVHPNIFSVTKTLGEWDIEIEIEVDSQIELRKIERQIRQRFFSLIQDVETIPIYNTQKKNYFPKFLIKK